MTGFTGNAENELYQEVVLEHKRAPRNFGHLPQPTHQAQGTNPSCGDRIAVELQLQEGRVQDIRFTGQGCGMGEAIADEVCDKLLALPRVGEITVNLVFDPPWDRSMMSEEAQLALGL